MTRNSDDTMGSATSNLGAPGSVLGHPGAVALCVCMQHQPAAYQCWPQAPQRTMT